MTWHAGMRGERKFFLSSHSTFSFLFSLFCFFRWYCPVPLWSMQRECGPHSFPRKIITNALRENKRVLTVLKADYASLRRLRTLLVLATAPSPSGSSMSFIAELEYWRLLGNRLGAWPNIRTRILRALEVVNFMYR